MSRSLIVRLVMYLSIFSIGLFAGFMTFFAFRVAPAMKDISFQTYFEVHQVFPTVLRQRVGYLYITIFLTTGLWLFFIRKFWRSLEFSCVTGVLFCTLDDLLLSYKGHYKINDVIRSYVPQKGVPTPSLLEVHTEWTQFMHFHFALMLVAFVLILSAHYLHFSGKKREPEAPFEKTILR